jgi:hypothetical protein
MLVAGVVHHQVHDHPEPKAMGLVHQAVEVRLRAEPRVDGGVVADVVADIPTG